MANRNWLSNKMYQMEAYPVLVSCTFVVDNSAGTGISGLAGGAIKSVYMNSSAPSAGNPNPDPGFIQVQLQDNYAKLLGMNFALSEPQTGAATNNVNAGELSVIASLGTTTAAQWLVAGLPAGVTAAVGQAFIPLATAAIGGTGTIKLSGSTDSFLLSLVGNPDVMLQNSNSAVNGGAILILATRDDAGAVGPLADGTKVQLSFYLSNSSVVVNGQ